MCFVVIVLGKSVYFCSPLPLSKSRLTVIDTKDPNTIMDQALVLLDVSLPSDGQTTGVGRLHLVFRITKFPTRTVLELRDCGMVK